MSVFPLFSLTTHTPGAHFVSGFPPHEALAGTAFRSFERMYLAGMFILPFDLRTSSIASRNALSCTCN